MGSLSPRRWGWFPSARTGAHMLHLQDSALQASDSATPSSRLSQFLCCCPKSSQRSLWTRSSGHPSLLLHRSGKTGCSWVQPVASTPPWCLERARRAEPLGRYSGLTFLLPGRFEATLKRPSGSARRARSRHHGGVLATGWTQLHPVFPDLCKSSEGCPEDRVQSERWEDFGQQHKNCESLEEGVAESEAWSAESWRWSMWAPVLADGNQPHLLGDRLPISLINWLCQ